MTKAQRQVMRRQLLDEKAVLSQLRKDYKEALSRVDSKIQDLMGRQDLTSSVVYQVRYQKMIKAQIEEALGNLRSGAYQHLSDYTESAYKTAFIGAQYSMQKQGVPLAFPIDRDAMVKAIRTDSKLSSSMYRRMGVNVTKLRNSVSAELSRGIASGSGYVEIARNIDGKFGIGMKNSMRIAQTEGHRISQESSLDAMRKAKEAGADIVKQWDSTLDGRTRDSHRELNGQVRDIDECFETSDGHKAMAPGQFGIPGEDINCRCVILQRARWAVKDGEGGYTKASRMEEKGQCRIVDMSSADGYQAFWNRYQAAMNKPEWVEPQEPSELRKALAGEKIKYKRVDEFQKPISDDEIIKRLGGADKTNGSCASLGLAYLGERNGLDVLDFRGGTSQRYFSKWGNLLQIATLPGVKSSHAMVYDEIEDGMKSLKSLKEGNFYYFAVAKHAAVVRRLNGRIQYLELQSCFENGWHDLDVATLQDRFGARHERSFGGYNIESPLILIDGNSLKGNNEFRAILGYINTAAENQKKGIGGSIR